VKNVKGWKEGARIERMYQFCKVASVTSASRLAFRRDGLKLGHNVFGKGIIANLVQVRQQHLQEHAFLVGCFGHHVQGCLHDIVGVRVADHEQSHNDRVWIGPCAWY
jgi:hypothetical protein